MVSTISFLCILILNFSVDGFSFPARLSTRSLILHHQNVFLHGQSSALTDWVVAGLEDRNQSITTVDLTQSGEGDTLPIDGLAIGKVRIFSAGISQDDIQNHTNHCESIPIQLLAARNGWGTGVHPTTRLCLEWICDTVQRGDVLLDYGCGSGILSIAALHLGASLSIGVDVEAEALVTAERNVQWNGCEGRFLGRHTREVLPFELYPPLGVSLCVANILIGQLVRPSMVAAIITNLKEGGLLCFSGIRPREVDSLKKAYDNSVEWLDDQYAELSASETVGCIESYGFDCGRWARLVGRRCAGRNHDIIEYMSEQAVS